MTPSLSKLRADDVAARGDVVTCFGYILADGGFRRRRPFVDIQYLHELLACGNQHDKLKVVKTLADLNTALTSLLQEGLTAR